jgi:hypothetical protein
MLQENYNKLPDYEESPEWNYKDSPPDFTFGDYRWVCTCSAFPEQYEVFYKEKQVAYVRLRYGVLRAYVPDVANGNLLFVTNFENQYQGDFMSEERRNFWIDFIQQELEFYYAKHLS